MPNTTVPSKRRRSGERIPSPGQSANNPIDLTVDDGPQAGSACCSLKKSSSSSSSHIATALSSSSHASTAPSRRPLAPLRSNLSVANARSPHKPTRITATASPIKTTITSPSKTPSKTAIKSPSRTPSKPPTQTFALKPATTTSPARKALFARAFKLAATAAAAPPSLRTQPFATRARLKKAIDKAIDKAGPCLGRRRCKLESHFCSALNCKRQHPLATLIPCKYMRGFQCQGHALVSLVNSAAWRDPDRAAKGNKERDGRRKLPADANEVPVPSSEVEAGIWPTMAVSKAALFDLINDVKKLRPSEAIELFVKKLPLLSREGLIVCSKSLKTVDIVFNALHAVRTQQPSVDLVHQFQDWQGARGGRRRKRRPAGSGRLAGHGTCWALGLEPRWWQGVKGSGHPFLHTMLLAAQRATAVLRSEADKGQVQAAVERLLHALSPLQVAYKLARKGRHLEPFMTALSGECHALLRPRGVVAATHTPAIKRALSIGHAQGPPTPNAARLAKTYRKVPQDVPARVWRHLNKEERRIMCANLEELRAAEAAVEAMSDDEAAAVGAAFGPLATLAEERFRDRLRGRKLRRNRDGMPTGVFHAYVKSRTLLRLAVRVSARAVLECDAGARQLAACGVQPWKRGDEWLIIAGWILHDAQHRAKDEWVGLSLDLLGHRHSLLGLCSAAHKTHRRPFFPPSEARHRPRVFTQRHLTYVLDANCVLQSHGVNQLLGSRRWEEIVQAICSTRHALHDILDRARRAGIFPVEERVLIAMRDYKTVAGPSGRDPKLRNGVEIWE